MELALMITVYILMAGITYFKQLKVTEYDNNDVVASIVALFWFISVPVYIIRAVFINDWKKQ